MDSAPPNSVAAVPPEVKQSIPLGRRIVYVALIYFAFLLLLLGVEVVTRLAMPHVNSLSLFVATPQQKMQVANEQQATIFEGDPLLLWRLKPNLDHAVWDFTVLSTNAQHFRADYPTKAKPAGTFRIVCLGDSVTFGYRVPVVWPDKPKDYDPEWLPYPMLLEKELRAANLNRQIEVLDMAVPGYTTHQGLAWLRRDIDYLQPDLVIASFGWNDVSVSDVPDREAIRTDWYPVAVRWLIDHSQAFAHATNWLRSRNRPERPPTIWPVPRVSEAEYVQNFQAIIDLARTRRAGIIVIGAPYRDRTTNPPEAELMMKYRQALRSTAERTQAPYLEILELTEAAAPANQGFFGELIHPNHIGHRLMTLELLKLMNKNRMLGELNIPDFVP
ncbi:MAG TPA: SGNH/GDSL hydrolase family protein [Pyrinomonadaceae bacterium]|nr:SGNH/GDSL hydrolase family protein [Pyrinomonadaceae bacterium]